MKYRQSNWTLDKYYKENNFKPSKHKLYVILDKSEDEVFNSDNEKEKAEEIVVRKKHDKIYSTGQCIIIFIAKCE